MGDVVVCDIGGTRSRLARVKDGRPTNIEVFDNASLTRLEDALTVYLGEVRDKLDALALGAAGPVFDGRCILTNLPWALDVRRLKRHARRVMLVNDMVPHAYQAAFVRPDFVTGPRQVGPMVVINPGTGYGLAVAYPNAMPQPTESGHAGLAVPKEAWCSIRPRKGSVEHWLSGPGLVRLYVAHGGKRIPGPAIVAKARDGRGKLERIAQETLRCFASLLAHETQNAMLRAGAFGGARLMGSLVRALSPELRQAFATLPPLHMRPFDTAPIGIIEREDLALSGLARLLLNFPS